MADQLSKALDIDVQLVSGDRGELSVWVDDRCIAQKDANGWPEAHLVVTGVAAALG